MTFTKIAIAINTDSNLFNIFIFPPLMISIKKLIALNQINCIFNTSADTV